jgi:hypothetical protein
MYVYIKMYYAYDALSRNVSFMETLSTTTTVEKPDKNNP